jgi:thioredoxin-like negative regulator of GroEL
MENLDAETTWLALEYLRGNLSEEEMDAVESRMEKDRDFYLLVHDLRQMQKAQEAAHDPQISERAQEAADTYFNASTSPKQKVKWLWWAAAASAAAILVIALTIFMNGGSYLDTYFSEAPPERTLSPSGTEIIRRGMEKYAQHDYPGAISDFETVPDTAQDYNTARYYLANAYLARKQPQRALDCLLILEARNDQKYRDGRRWLLGLIYLDQGETEKGEKELRSLQKDSNYKNSAIKEILDRL